MKWHFAFAFLALVHHTVARGLKTRTEAAPSKKLEAENEELRKRNTHLKAMMQVARDEVHRMDHAVKARSVEHHAGNDAEEVAGLQKQLQSAKADRKALAKTLKQMLGKNSTKIFKAQADKAVQAEHALELRFDEERKAFEARIKEANGKVSEAKDIAQTLQDQNMDLQRSTQDLRAQVAKTQQKDGDLATDKANLVETMRSLMRDTAKAKKELKMEKDKEQKELQELAVVKAELANVTKGKHLRKPAVAKNGKKASKTAPLHLNHQESMASKIAKLHDINRYIEGGTGVPSDENTEAAEEVAVAPTTAPKKDDWAVMTKQVDTLQKQEDAFARSRVHNHVSDKPQDVVEAAAVTQQSEGLSDWLGLKAKRAQGAIPKDANGLSPIDALDPEAVKQEKVVEAKKAKEDADDGGDGIENLLSQAKDQISAMDSAEAA